MGNQALAIVQMDTYRWLFSASVEVMARSSTVRVLMREMEQVLLESEEASGTSDRDESDGRIAKSLSACMGRRCMERPASPWLPPTYAHAT